MHVGRGVLALVGGVTTIYPSPHKNAFHAIGTLHGFSGRSQHSYDMLAFRLRHGILRLHG